jgi:type II secretory pathway pseudopilin PulG
MPNSPRDHPNVRILNGSGKTVKSCSNPWQEPKIPVSSREPRPLRARERPVHAPCLSQRGADEELVDQTPLRASPRATRGFTIVDLIVSLAVMMVLISLLLPSLSSVRETANQVVCRSNVRQIGLGMQMYADDNGERIPYSFNAAQQSDHSWATNTLRIASHGWDGLGYMFTLDYLPAPKLYYGPSHRGQHPYAEYTDAWDTEMPTEIIGNYQYRGEGISTINPVNSPSPIMTQFLSGMRPSTALVSDGLRSISDFNHEIGANILRAGLDVSWFNDRGGRVAALLAKDGQMPVPGEIDEAWDVLDGRGP